MGNAVHSTCLWTVALSSAAEGLWHMSHMMCASHVPGATCLTKPLPRCSAIAADYYAALYVKSSIRGFLTRSKVRLVVKRTSSAAAAQSMPELKPSFCTAHAAQLQPLLETYERLSWNMGRARIATPKGGAGGSKTIGYPSHARQSPNGIKDQSGLKHQGAASLERAGTHNPESSQQVQPGAQAIVADILAGPSVYSSQLQASPRPRTQRPRLQPIHGLRLPLLATGEPLPEQPPSLLKPKLPPLPALKSKDSTA